MRCTLPKMMFGEPQIESYGVLEPGFSLIHSSLSHSIFCYHRLFVNSILKRTDSALLFLFTDYLFCIFHPQAIGYAYKWSEMSVNYFITSIGKCFCWKSTRIHLRILNLNLNTIELCSNLP